MPPGTACAILRWPTSRAYCSESRPLRCNEIFDHRSMSRNLLFEGTLKILQIFFVNVGNRPVIEVAFNPME